VRTKNLPSRFEKVVVVPAYVNDALLKSPSTVASLAAAIARAWCDWRHSFVWASWHGVHAGSPT
jgi:hypothetical protein